MWPTPETKAGGDGVRSERLGQLRRMLEGYQHRRNGGALRFVPTGLAPLDEALPHGGLPAGAVTEVFSALDGGGAMTLACYAARAAASQTRTVVIVDTPGDFYPPAVWRLGILWDRLLVIRPRNTGQALWAVDQALRCGAVAAVVAPIPRIDLAASRRLQLAAESGGGIGLLLRPVADHAGLACQPARQQAGRASWPADRDRSFAAVQMLVEPVVVSLETSGGYEPGISRAEVGVNRLARAARAEFVRIAGRGVTRLCRVTLLKVREGMPVEPFLVEVGHEAGPGSLLPVPEHGSAESERRRISA